jgi:hypothetical protein
MPVVGIYTKDFPTLGRDLLDSDIIVVAIAGNVVTYRSTVGAMRSRFFVENSTTSELSAATLSATYTTAGIGFEVICQLITDNPLIYKKTSTGWYSIPLGTVS